jgi:flavin reductase (DIM6/NTAB) family NADH-FMN oxidoreductase RutF
MHELSAFLPSSLASPEIAGAIGAAFGLVAGTMLARQGVAGSIAATSTTCPKSAVSAPSFSSSSIRNRPPYTPGTRQTLPTSSKLGKQVQVFNPSELKSSYNLMISTVTPRPIALVSSRSKSGIDNVSPFSYFGAVAHDPPMLSIGFCRKGSDRVQKDSIANILETKEFAVNIISEWYLDAANQSCGEYKSDVDEFVESGLTKTDCQVVSAPRVAEAAVTYECRVEHVYPVKDDDGRPTTEIVLARVVRVHVDREVLMDDFDPLKPVVDTAKLRPVGRLGGNTYCSIGETLDMARPRV